MFASTEFLLCIYIYIYIYIKNESHSIIFCIFFRNGMRYVTYLVS